MDNRRHERFATDIPVKIRIPGGKGKAKFEAHARLRDLSLGGAFVMSGFRFKNDIDELEIDILFPSGTLPVKGRLVRQPDGGLAIEFIELDADGRVRLLSHFIPDQHRAFYDQVAKRMLPTVNVDRVSLVIHLWEAWKKEGAPPPPGKKPTPASKPVVKRR